MRDRRRTVNKAVLLTHGRAEQVADGVERVTAICADLGVELVIEPEEAAKHGREPHGESAGADVAVVLGGDGTMLRALNRFLGADVPVLGVNFGRVGFLCTISRDQLEPGLRRAFGGELQAVELATLAVRVNGASHVAVNDAVVTSATLGRMIELEWAAGGEDLGRIPCDGLICSTPSGSTAYNLSNGGPVLMWGIEAMATTFVAPHSLHARPLVISRGCELTVWNRTADVPATVLVDGHAVGEVGADEQVIVTLGKEFSLLGTLPESTFVSRYRRVFAT
ncbi:MAG: NAD(+)/NADH kinase [Gaiellales bacterium]